MYDEKINNKFLKRILIIMVWIIVWHVSISVVNRNLLIPIPTPTTTCQAILRLLKDVTFYITAIESIARILIGFIAALLTGTILAMISAKHKFFKDFVSPVLTLIRAVPVASLTILIFLWIAREKIPSFISFFIVFPVIWANVEKGIESIDNKLVEMANVFGMKKRKIYITIIFPDLMPYIVSAITTGIGLAWKSGVAAEVICRTNSSLGNLLWVGKNSIDYNKVFAVTIIIAFLSYAIQKLITFLCYKIYSPKR